MPFFDMITNGYTEVLHFVAEFSIYTLELVGILIILVGSIRVIMHTVNRLRRNQPINVMIELGKSLALALEFKMGAEIVKTVIVRDLKELGVLAIVIALRASIALLIHWEIKSERHDQELKAKAKSIEKMAENSEPKS